MARLKNSFLSYFQESFQELKKVTWPTRNQAIRLTFIVLGFCVVATAFLGVLDLSFNFGYHSLVDYAAKVVPPAAVTDTTPDLPPVTQELQEKKASQQTSEVKASAAPSQQTSQTSEQNT